MGCEIMYEGTYERFGGGSYILQHSYGTWVPTIGIVSTGRLDGGSFGCMQYMQLDGKVFYRSGVYKHNNQTMVDFENEGLCIRAGTSPFYFLDPTSGLHTGVAEQEFYPLIGWYGDEIRTQDFYYVASGNRIRKTPLDFAGGWQYFADKLVPSNVYVTFHQATISKYSSAEIMLVSKHGQVSIFNIDTDTPNERWYDLGFSVEEKGNMIGGWYVNEWDLVVCRFPDQVVKVYSLETIPAVLSAVTMAPTAEEGQLSEVAVTLTGGHNDPCRDYPVDWSITAGGGSLTESQSLTDVEGKAVTYYRPPYQPSGDVTIEAKVTT